MAKQQPIQLLLMADYLADPLWTRREGRGGARISLDQLPLSAELKSRLRAWAARFDCLMDTDYAWPSESEEATWIEDGRVLLRPIQDELGPAYDVEYFDNG